MKELLLTQNKVALIDDEDFEWLNQWKWCAQKNGNNFYAMRAIIINGKHKNIFMHNMILGFKGVDHCSGDGLDNRRQNLRLANQSQNQANMKKRKNTSSIYKGVCWHKRDQHWRAHICKNRKYQTIGSFKTEIEAAFAYNKKAVEFFGEYARLNEVIS